MNKKPSLARTLLWAGVPALLMTVLIVGGSVYHQFFVKAPTFEHATLTIKHANGDGTVPYDVEVAKTPEQEEFGLMYRRSLAANNGMIFLWDNDQVIRMWMKNTYIPLDMLFVESNGNIEKIVVHAMPFDLTPIPSDEPIRAVIEIGGGEAARLGIKTGDKVLFPGLSGTP